MTLLLLNKVKIIIFFRYSIDDEKLFLLIDILYQHYIKGTGFLWHLIKTNHTLPIFIVKMVFLRLKI